LYTDSDLRRNKNGKAVAERDGEYAQHGPRTLEERLLV
jgi:hypothetical protein